MQNRTHSLTLCRRLSVSGNATRDEAVLDLFEYTEVVCNCARMHAALGNLSLAEFEEANWPEDKSRSKAA